MYGESRALPTRRALIDAGHWDLADAIAGHGGAKVVAEALQWAQATSSMRRPRGYWGSLSNVQSEVDECIAEHGLPARMMPTRGMLKELGRKDIVKAIEGLGGFAWVRSDCWYPRIVPYDR